MQKLVDENWLNLNFTNLIDLIENINKIKFILEINLNIINNKNNIINSINDYISIINNKFDDKNNIKKLIEYIEINFISLENEKHKNFDEIYINKKYNFRFIIENLKSNGFLFFEEFYDQLKKRYNNKLNIYQIKKDKNIIKYFINIISNKNSNSVERYVNELLIKLRDYINDLEDSYNNLLFYQKINIKKELEKHININLSDYNRNLTTFNIFKYSLINENKIKNYKLNYKIETYFDNYKNYYSSRYPDRCIDFDPILTTLIISMNFNSKNYFIHMALIQYLVLDKIFNLNDGINIQDLCFQIGININDIEDTINSLLKVKIIKRSNDENIENIKFYINNEFYNEKNKISISSLVINQNELLEFKKEFLHDRNTIVLLNLNNYAKKNKFFTADTIIDELQYKIPFKINMQYIEDAITKSLDKEYIKLIEVPNINDNSIQIMYQYIE